MRRAVVQSIGHYLPERVVENSEFESTLDTNDFWIRSRTGIERRHFAAKNETTSDMGIKATQAALENAGCTVDDIDAIILATSTADLTFPSAATMVQNCYGKPVKQFLEINTSNNCFFAYTPDVLVMLPGSAVISDTTISRGQGSVILFIDAFDTFDLGQKGQVFDMISAKTKIFGPKEDLVALDCFHITGRSLLETNSPIGSWRTVINCLLLGDLETLPSQEVLEACGTTTQDCIIGVSNLPNGAGLCLRVLCKSSIAAKLVMNQIFSKCVVHLTGYYPEPRKK